MPNSYKKILNGIYHRCQWFGFIAAAIFVPLSYSVGLLIFDLRVMNQGEWINKEGIWTKDVQLHVKIAIDSVRVFLYNIVTTFLLFFMSKRYIFKIPVFKNLYIYGNIGCRVRFEKKKSIFKKLMIGF